MKSKLLLLSFLMLLTVATNYAQTSASQAGIAVQGIARDNNNTARISMPINLTFRVYYGANVLIYEIAKTVTTDGFGVFSVVLEPGATNNIVMANNQAFLRISEGTTIISDEILRQVPYAIAAANGVPTGSIMPYIGTTVPEGWVLCDGRSLSTISGSAALIALVGTTAPNLQGMFLRGTGTSPMNNEPGPALKAMQGEELKSHQHSSGSLVNATNGVHNHRGTNDLLNKLVNYTGVNTATSVDNNLKQLDLINGTNIPDDGDHTHTISGSTGMTSGTETRPVNYGVNYIIKL
jgi:microcystin-dependent protein